MTASTMTGEKLNWPHIAEDIDVYRNYIDPFVPNSHKKVFLAFEEPRKLRTPNREVIARQDHFDLIVTNDMELLPYCRNGIFHPMGTTFVSREHHDRMDFSRKRFAVSFICGAKEQLEGHIMRLHLWVRQKEIRIPKTFFISSFQPIRPIENNPLYPPGSKIGMFTDFQYHIAIENSSYASYFTEKIIDCFITKTIPIYWGSPDIGRFFNLDGIIQVNSIEEIIDACNNLKEGDYQARMAAIEENFRLCLNYAYYDLPHIVCQKLGVSL